MLIRNRQALFFAILAGGYHHIPTAGKFVCLAVLQVKLRLPPSPSSIPLNWNLTFRNLSSSLMDYENDNGQFFFNFGANATTFIIPAEVFPSRVRGFAHGFSAATGKLGAILSALLFNYLSSPKLWGLPGVMWVFFGW